MLHGMPIIPFYGAENWDLFEIERAAMDRPGKVIRYLDEVLPDGDVLDIGTGRWLHRRSAEQPIFDRCTASNRHKE